MIRTALIAAAALAATADFAAAQTDPELEAAALRFERSKPLNPEGQTRRDGRIACMVHWLGWANWAAFSEENLALYNPEISYAFATEQFNIYYGRVVRQDNNQDYLGDRLTEALEGFYARLEGDVDLDAWARDIGRCYVRMDVRQPPDDGGVDPRAVFANLTGTEQNTQLLFDLSGNYALFADAMSIGSYAMAADIAFAEINQNGYATIPQAELEAVAWAALNTGEGHLMSEPLRRSLAESDPQTFRVLMNLPGGASASSAQFGQMSATATSGLHSSASAASNDARSRATVMVNDRCEAIGGRPTRTNAGGAPARQVGDNRWRATSTATTVCAQR